MEIPTYDFFISSTELQVEGIPPKHIREILCKPPDYPNLSLSQDIICDNYTLCQG